MKGGGVVNPRLYFPVCTTALRQRWQQKKRALNGD